MAKQEFLNDIQNKRRPELILGLILILVLSFFLPRAGIFKTLETLVLDAHFHIRGERTLPDDIVIIGIDEASLDHPQSGPWPWPRENHAQLLFTLDQAQSRPAAIGYDILFERQDAKDEAGDTAFTYRAKNLSDRLVFAYFMEHGYRSRFERNPEKEKRLRNFSLKVDGAKPPRLEVFDKVSLPFQGLAESGALGFVNLPRDSAGLTRKVKLIAEYRGQVYPSMELVLYARFLHIPVSDIIVKKNSVILSKGEEVVRQIPVTEEGDMLIDFYGPLSRDKQYYPFIHVVLGDSILSPSQSQKMYKSLNNRITLIGRTAPSLQESYVTPFSSVEPGVQIRAQALANLLEGHFLSQAGLGWTSFLIFLMGFLSLLLAMALPVTRSLPGVAMLNLVYGGVTYLSFRAGMCIPFVQPCAAMIVVYVAILAFRYFTALEELKKTQAELIHSTKMAMVGQISSGMAHEFRNILHAIKLHVEGCAQPGMKPERVQRYMGVIFKTMNNAEMILNGILAFSRKERSNKKVASLKQTIEDTLLLLKKEMLYQRIEVSQHLDDVPPIAHDVGQISQVLMNLINNARDALKEQEKKVVIIRLREDGRYAVLDVADNGPGIPPEVMKRLFEPFVTSKAAGKGTGLGLSVSRDIVENHGGELTVTSVPGEGTVWHIRLPKDTP